MDLEGSAGSWDPPFDVERNEIQEKLTKGPQVAVLQSDSRVVGFVAATPPLLMPRTKMTFRYVKGALVDRQLGGKRKFMRLMQSLGERADVEVLHTQNYHMANALGAWSETMFPHADRGLMLGCTLRDDLKDLLESLHRPTNFCPVTGICPGMYPRCLYKRWPLPGAHLSNIFRDLAKHSGVMVVGFKNASLAQQWLTSIAVDGGTHATERH